MRASQRAVAFLSLCVNGAASGDGESAARRPSGRAQCAADTSEGSRCRAHPHCPPVQPLPPRLCAPSDADLDTGDGPRVVAVLLLLFFLLFFFFFFGLIHLQEAPALERAEVGRLLSFLPSLPWT